MIFLGWASALTSLERGREQEAESKRAGSKKAGTARKYGKPLGKLATLNKLTVLFLITIQGVFALSSYFLDGLQPVFIYRQILLQQFSCI
ncbi:hypothetical protein [Nostoc sp. UIC 10630]|uniref:hypothetical protein n=1 Tax=Nostoc sp. UIC 10630 TaxID=2100146 RepID=UPI0013D883CC|nr:hypothetical protein [Nostoc sp. UIC 10630]NEU84496.1 hypothetical protein [Nostoc sp. UIC 10630]